MKNRFRFMIGVYLAALLLGMITGCTKEKCVVCLPDQPPAEKEYHLIYSYGNPGYWVYTFSTKSLKVVDSVSYSGNPFDALQFTRDGKYACYSKPGVTWVTDYASGDTIAIDNDHGGPQLSISKGDRMLMVLAGSRTTVFGLPQLNILYTVPSGISAYSSCFDPTEDVAYIPIAREDSLLIVRFDSTGIHDHKIGLAGTDGTSRHGLSAAVTPDGSILLLILTDGNDSRYLQLRDTDSLRLMAEYYPSYSGPFIHPDGRRVFFFNSSRPFDYPAPWAVYVLDLKTRIIKRVVDGVDYQAFWKWPYLELSQIDFTPDGRYAFLRSGAGMSGSPPIAKLDLDTYEIVDAIYPDRGVSRAMRIYPLEINGGN
ncbi:MAG: hypothetical protein NT028_10610 [candidate division Zixibacteria bacterium]|nr:hypothetical protein [candidate division Zixibacteria bacterium]